MTDLPSIEYPDWEANQPDGYTRSLNQVLAAQEHQELEVRNQEFRAICDRRDFQVTHIWARPDEDPVTDRSGRRCRERLAGPERRLRGLVHLLRPPQRLLDRSGVQ
jgi:hypothetical protein